MDKSSQAAALMPAETVQTAQSSVKDWQAAIAAAGYRVVGPLYASSSQQAQPPKTDSR
jgi:hypothetical protein